MWVCVHMQVLGVEAVSSAMARHQDEEMLQLSAVMALVPFGQCNPMMQVSVPLPKPFSYARTPVVFHSCAQKTIISR